MRQTREFFHVLLRDLKWGYPLWFAVMMAWKQRHPPTEEMIAQQRLEDEAFDYIMGMREEILGLREKKDQILH